MEVRSLFLQKRDTLLLWCSSLLLTPTSTFRRQQVGVNMLISTRCDVNFHCGYGFQNVSLTLSMVTRYPGLRFYRRRKMIVICLHEVVKKGLTLIFDLTSSPVPLSRSPSPLNLSPSLCTVHQSNISKCVTN